MPPTLYLPEDPDYTLVDSVRDSVRFAHYCLEPASHGRWFVPSSAVRKDGSPAEVHPLRGLEGTGGEANALGGALILYRWARFDQNHILEKVALGLLDHILEDGFLERDGLPNGYRDTATGAFFLNRERDNSWYAPAEIARTALQMLWWSDALGASGSRPDRLREAAAQIGERVISCVDGAGGGWLPARQLVAGGAAGTAGAEGLYAAWLEMELEERGLAATREAARALLDTYLRAGGKYGWGLGGAADGEDTTRGRALAMRVLRRASALFRDPSPAEFALGEILPVLESRLLNTDRHGLPTTGLVAADSARTAALMADAAECSLACQEAAETTGDRDRLCAGVTMLRAVARVHHAQSEPHGFLATGLDLDTAHSPSLPLSACTTPLYGNLLHVEAALLYLSSRVS